MSSLVTLAHGASVQAVSAANSYAVTVARMMFARDHGIAADEVDVAIEYASGLFEGAPTAVDLAIVNAE